MATSSLSRSHHPTPNTTGKQRFEQALIVCPLEHKLRLYGRYICWVEETYPSLGAASELRSILYRCVKETSGLEGVHNHPIYVDVWLKLVNCCDAPTELFNLLFYKGVGTLRAKFYISWIEHIQHLPEGTSTQPLKKWARLATILARGLRAGAEPIVLLEERAENLLRSVQYEERLREEERCFEELSCHRRHASQPTGGGGGGDGGGDDGERKILAPLRTIEPIDAVVGEPSIVPSVRTAHALHPEWRGLPCLEGKSNPLRQSEKPSMRLRIYRDEESRAGLPNLPPIDIGISDLGKSLSRLGEPVASWNAENVEAPVARLDRRTALSSASVLMSTSQPRTLTIYRDPSEKTIRPSRSPSGGCQPSTSARPRGLRIATRGEKPRQQHDSLLYSYECLKCALLAEEMPQAKEAEKTLADTELNTTFFCDVDALYSQNEETCFEMNRVLRDANSSHAIETDFALDLNDPHSRSLIGEIERLVSDDYLEEEDAAQTRPAKRNDYSNLIRRLEAIIDKVEDIGHSKEEQAI